MQLKSKLKPKEEKQKHRASIPPNYYPNSVQTFEALASTLYLGLMQRIPNYKLIMSQFHECKIAFTLSHGHEWPDCDIEGHDSL